MMNKKIAVLILGLFVLGSCTKSEQEPASTQQAGQTNTLGHVTPFSLTLEGGLDGDLSHSSEARAFAFEVASEGPKLKMTEESIPSVAIIANTDKSVVYYLNINWRKTAGQNHLYFKDEEITTDLFGQAINLSASNQWYIMGYLGGEFDPVTRQVRYNPNGTSLNANGVEPTVKRVPVVFPWAKLEVKHYGANQLALSGQDRIKFKTLGMMMRLQLTNKFSSPVRVKSIKYQSNALTTTAGYYDLNLTNLPATSNTTTLPLWVGSGSVEPSYTLVDANGGALNVDISANGTSPHSFLVWGMPKTVASGTTPMTHVLADVTRLSGTTEEAYPKMGSLYIWGSTNMPIERSRRKISAQLYREKMALEYFAKNYVGHNGFNVANQAVAQTTTSLAWGGIPLFTYTQASKANALTSDWRVPGYKDARALYNIDLSNNLANIEALKFSGNVIHTVSGQSVRVNGVAKTYTDVYRTGATIYALRFDDDGKRLYSAWRYSFSTATGATIESVYLGPNYKGSIADISQASFWSLHQNDIVKRFYLRSYYVADQIYSTFAHFWALTDTSVTELGASASGERRWVMGYKNAQGEYYLTHRQHYYTNGAPMPSTAHIIPIEAVEATPTWHD